MTGGFAVLPVAEDGGEMHDGSHLAGVSRILGPRFLQLPTLTVGLLGVQVLWSVEMSYGTPYLISLGLSKSAVAMVFLAGPISGLVVQPLIGVLADNSKSRFGRRRPYMLGGVFICAVAILLLGFTRPFASLFTRPSSIGNDLLTIWLAIIAIFSIDFSINAVQAVDRALLVDTLPSSEQPDGNAWAARMLGVGSVAGYFIGNVDMTSVLPFLGDTELEVLSVVGAFLLLLTHAAMAYCVKEKVVVDTGSRSAGGFRKEVIDLWTNMRTLPPAILQICLIQFFAWIGWFPVLFNTTEFIAELHKRAHPDLDPAHAGDEGTRLGTRAMFYSSILSLGISIIMPFFVAEASSRKALLSGNGMKKSRWVRAFEMVKVHLASLWAASHLLFAVCMFATFFYSGVLGATVFTTLTGFSWAITQWAPFTLLAEEILADDAEGEDTSSILLDDARSRRMSGTLEGQEEERQFLVGHDEDEDVDVRHANGDDLADEVRSFRSSASMDENERGDLADVEARSKLGALLHNREARSSHLNVTTYGAGPSGDEGELGGRKRKGGSLAAKAGTIMGIQNIFVVIPQFIITGISSIIFAIMNPGGSPEMPEETEGLENGANSTSTELLRREGPGAVGGGPQSYAVVFRLGGFAAIVAFILTVRLARLLRRR